MIPASPGRCEEQVALPGGGVLPCNKPAGYLVGWPARGEGPYRMCFACMNHSVKNRAATVAGLYEGETS